MEFKISFKFFFEISIKKMNKNFIRKSDVIFHSKIDEEFH